MNHQTQSRLEICHWLLAFLAMNALLSYIVGYVYLAEFNFTHYIDFTLNSVNIYGLYIFLFLAYVGTLGIICLTPILLLLPICWILPLKRIVIPITILINSLILITLFFDAIIFYRFNFHISPLLFTVFINEMFQRTFALSWIEWTLLALACSAIVGAQILIAKWLWKPHKMKPFFHRAIYFFIGISIALICSYLLLFTAIRSHFYPAFQNARVLPVYSQWILPHLPLSKEEEFFNNYRINYLFLNKNKKSKLIYPLSNLECSPTTKPMNILFIVIDAWRFDMLTPKVTPHLFKLSQESWNFKHHYSPGNNTITGLISLFYSIPGTYWLILDIQHQMPVLLRQLKQQHYDISLFVSSHLNILKRTIFHNLGENYFKITGDDPYQRDQNITEQFQNFASKVAKSHRPFFSFLMYDGGHSYCDSLSPYQLFQPIIPTCNRFTINNKSDPVPYMNRYKNALYSVDHEIAKVIETLKAKKLYENTILIITGDHGEEFNETKLNSWGHSSAYNDYQLRIPLIIHWPGKTAAQFQYTTTHLDIAPTLMSKALQCESPIAEYSSGKLLSDHEQRLPFLASSYSNFAVLENQRIYSFFPSGEIRVMDRQGHIIYGAKTSNAIMDFAIDELNRFTQN